ncbi:MAG: hypothetical protein R3F41_13400 [Gammaproteobacteria bacterium]|nr:hypothetical protein [Pseudomonadales bacterium]
MGGDRPGDDTEYPAHQFGVGGMPETQGERDSQHPLVDGPGWQYLVHLQGSVFHDTVGAF